MSIIPCALCGYDSPTDDCPHCSHDPLERSLASPVRGLSGGLGVGAVALFKGLGVLSATRGTKRWMVPPLILTGVLLVLSLWWTFSFLNGLVDAHLPGEFAFAETRLGWLEGLGENWQWLKSGWAGVLVALQWVVNTLWGMLLSTPLKLLAWFLIGSLVMWYCFSIAYEALAGPFLDEVQGRVEARWFGADPRGRLERPNDIPPERCARLSTVSLVLCLVPLALILFIEGVSWWWLLVGIPACFVPAMLVDRRFGPWLGWIVKIESRAALVSLQASIVTGFLIVPALLLYFVPGVGYLLFAVVCGFATSVGLLDIPLERRGWSLGQRLRFVGRNLPALIVFGIVAGFLLAVPILGPILMVPSASLGGLWLICRLDKSAMRPADAELASRRAAD